MRSTWSAFSSAVRKYEVEADTNYCREKAKNQEDDLPASKCGIRISTDMVGNAVGEIATEHLRYTAHREPDSYAESLLLCGVPL
jgi:hypothetical protein